MVELQDCAYDDSDFYFDGGGMVGAGHLGLGISLMPRFEDTEESATDEDTIVSNSHKPGKNNNSRSRSTKNKRQLSQ